jgi:hypothetical protein
VSRPIHLAQMGLPNIGESAACRLSLAAELIDAGVAPRELARELGFALPVDLLKYDPDQPRVPAGSGRESGQWTSNGAGTGTLTQDRLAPTAPTPVQVAQDVKCSAFISENCKGSILREFPSEYLDLSTDQLLKDAEAGVPAAKKSKKLFFDNRFRK